MALPLLNYAPASQNSRVAGFTVGSDNSPRIYNTANLLSSTEMDDLIEAAYRQIFFHAFATDREVALESQLRSGNISVRQFVRGLILSDTYRRSFYEKNSNYRFVEQTVQRVLGRDVYSEKEKIAWSIVVATKGIEGFIDALLNSDEYLEAFGEDTLPYQRRRVLPSQAIGEVPFNIKSPRYDAYHRAQLGFPQLVWQNTVRSYVVTDRAPKTGDPALFLNMARSINANPVNSTPVSAQNLDYERLVPRR
ncbi:phycobilisome rod-core linker polypeptide [Pseudanabaena sp. 'Roaring Creek']|uniref:phycobilisome rod-core linker polypeptide n=1 Tax=Pseudanabaena sp. 'Roaring Creek' TaxID=1681830 RepID=UPI0006D7770E|nr:phycobilisome rod-core linker polypeptide [Pseudanabaena sp. 'Roaring Creek']